MPECKSSGHLGLLAFLLFFLCIPLCIHSSDSLFTDVETPELIELDYENLELETWLPDETGLQTGKKRPNLQTESRHNWKPGDERLTNRLIISPSSHKTSSNPYLYATFYQKLTDGDKPVNLASATLMLSTRNRLKNLTLGSFRLQAGEGLVLGSYSPSDKSQSRYIHPAYSLSHPALTGFAAELNLAGLDLVAWLSQTQRIAALNQGKIIRLYESSLTQTADKGMAKESSGGVIAGYRRKLFRFGGYIYHQDYDKAFADTTLSILDNVGGFFAGYDNKPVTLGFETGFTGGGTAQSLSAGYRNNVVTHLLRYIYRPEAYPLPYARTAQVFGQKTAREELSWDLRYRFMSNWLFISRIAAVKDVSDQADSNWKERLIFAVNHSGVDWQSGLTYYRFRRDAVPFQDTLSSGILPTQHRLKAHWEKGLSPRLTYKSSCQYQHYLDRKVTKNGFSLLQSVVYMSSKSDIGLSFLTWTNQKSLYQPTELPTDDELLASADSDSAFRLHIRQKFGDGLAVYFYAYRPLYKAGRQFFGLNLKAQI
jgi:hypothetical protein